MKGSQRRRLAPQLGEQHRMHMFLRGLTVLEVPQTLATSGPNATAPPHRSVAVMWLCLVLHGCVTAWLSHCMVSKPVGSVDPMLVTSSCVPLVSAPSCLTPPTHKQSTSTPPLPPGATPNTTASGHWAHSPGSCTIAGRLSTQSSGTTQRSCG